MQTLTENPLIFMLLLNLLVLAVGTVIDSIAALVLIVPILLPIAQKAYGIDPYYFGVVICLNLVIGLLTPPVGTALYVTANVAKCNPLALMKPLAPFLMASLLVLLLITLFPQITLVLIGR